VHTTHQHTRKDGWYVDRRRHFFIVFVSHISTLVVSYVLTIHAYRAMTLLLIPGSNWNFKLKTSVTEFWASHLDPCTFNMMEHMHPSWYARIIFLMSLTHESSANQNFMPKPYALMLQGQRKKVVNRSLWYGVSFKKLGKSSWWAKINLHRHSYLHLLEWGLLVTPFNPGKC
jgi:hypothetical protein